jgi:hypothetical protein
MRLYCQPAVFKASIRMHHDEKADCQWNKRKPDCFFFKQMAAHGENQPSRTIPGGSMKTATRSRSDGRNF